MFDTGGQYNPLPEILITVRIGELTVTQRKISVLPQCGEPYAGRLARSDACNGEHPSSYRCLAKSIESNELGDYSRMRYGIALYLPGSVP